MSLLALTLPVAFGLATPPSINATGAQPVPAVSSTPSLPNGLCNAADHPKDCLALVQMWRAWDKKPSSWKVDGNTTMCDWDGVECDEQNGLRRVTSLWLNPNVIGERLTGTIPTEVGLLSELYSLGLFDHELSGTLPTELGLLKESDSVQHLSLFGNSLSGTIPTELGGLKMMGSIFLDDNSLSGTIPTELIDGAGREIWGGFAFGFAKNSLSGTIPESICKLSSVHRHPPYPNQTTCGLNGNPFACPLPSCAADLSANCYAKCQ